MARNAGGFTYIVNVVPQLVRLAPERRIRVLVRSNELAAALAGAPNLEIEQLPAAGLGRRLHFTFFAAARAARRWGADVYLAAGDLAPLRNFCPTIVSFRNPNVFTRLDQGWYPYQLFRLGVLRHLDRLSARLCDRVLFVSDDSARWIGDAIGLPARKRTVIHHGIDAARFSAVRGPRPHPRPYVLSVSTIYRYKNFVRLIKAWTRLARGRDDVPDLVIVGDDADPDYTVRMHAARRDAGILAERIRIAGTVGYARVPEWYAAADLFAFPSYLETFGHPLLEAMAAGVPIVAGDIAVSREVAGDAAVYADPYDVDALSAALERGLFDRALRERLRAAGRERVRRFTWEASARGHLELFDALCGAETVPRARSVPSRAESGAHSSAARLRPFQTRSREGRVP